MTSNCILQCPINKILTRLNGIGMESRIKFNFIFNLMQWKVNDMIPQLERTRLMFNKYSIK